MRGPRPGAVCTLEDIAQQLGITRERVRQIENAALNKIRVQLLADPDIREYLSDIGALPTT